MQKKHYINDLFIFDLQTTIILYSNMIDVARELLDMEVVPISCNNKKIPVKKQWTKITSETALKHIVSNANLGVLTGKVSQITVIDIDVKDNGLSTWNKLLKTHGDITNTPIVKTGTGGYHYYFNHNDKLKSDSKVVIYEDEYVGIDIKNNGGYVVCPPSINAEGNKYKWIKKFGKYKPIDIPEWFFSYLKITKNKKTDVTVNGGKKKPKPESELEASDCVNLYDKAHIRTLLNTLLQNRVDNYSTWIEVGMALFNSGNKPNEFFGLWKEWSQKSSKYVDGICESKWVSFNKEDDGLTIASIHHWAKQDNPVEYNKYKKEECIHKFIEENQDTMSVDGDKIEVNNMVSKPFSCTADIGDKYCLVSKNEHEQPMNFLEVIKNNGAYIACKHADCYGKYLKDKIFKIDDKMMQILFDGKTVNINIANQIQNINNYGNINEEADILICDNYEIFEDKELNALIMESLNNTDHDIAKVIWYLYHEQFNCTKDKKWYAFENHRWVQNSVNLREKISNDLPKYYKIVLKYYRNLLKSSDNCKEILFKITRITELIKSLKKVACKTNIVSSSADIFYANNKSFENKLDQNMYLIGFDNGIYDLTKMKFRDGQPNDFLTMTTGYNYDPSQKNSAVNKMIQEIFVNENVRTYFLKLIAYCLSGCTKIQKFFSCSGIGSNGKSLIFDLISKTFGDYFAFVPVALITQKRNGAENASPQLFRTINKRIIVFSESNKDEPLNLGLVKEYTGGDKLIARGLNQDPVEFKPQFKPFILCNHLPTLDANDDFSVWRRLRNIRFTSRFVDDPIEKNEYKKDENLSSNFDEWKCVFMNMLLDYYKLFNKDGLHDIHEIIETTNEYKNNENIYAEFINEYLEKTDNKQDYIVWTDLKQQYESWYQNNYHKQPPKSKEIKKYFEDNIFKKECCCVYVQSGTKYITIRGWICWKFAEPAH